MGAISLKRKKERPIKTTREKITEMLDMPKEVVLDSPKLTVIGDNQITIENYSGIMEYANESIRIKTSAKTITIIGERLEIRTITDVDILIEGIIKGIQFN